MISVSGKIWTQQKVNKNLVEKVKQDYGFSNILSQLIISRKYDISEIYGIKNKQKITNLFKNDYDYQKASALLFKTIKYNENICILGDYDVDGVCATSILIRYFNHINQKHFFYIPDRVNDGYGPSKKLFQKLLLKQPKLIIMVDCGSTANEAIDYLNQNNVKSIIIDHHEINKPYPRSNVIINPKKNSSNIERSFLCATSLTYFFIDFLIKKSQSSFELSNLLIYVLLATICDVMPLRKINKIIAQNTINEFNLNDNFALNYIFDQFNLKKNISVDDLGFLIGPIINSGGRLNYPKYAVDLLSSDNKDIIKNRANKLIILNNKRKQIEQTILKKIDFEKIKKENKNIIIYYQNNLNEGLIGIIAARLKDYFNKPVIVITKSNNFLKASARSNPSFNIGILIKSLLDKNIIDKGGGHNMAAGFTLRKNNLKLLNDFIQNEYLKKMPHVSETNKYDMELSASALNIRFLNDINKLGPFGNFNFSPIILIKNVRIIKSQIVKNKHISVIIKPKIGSSIKAICFNCLNTNIGDHLLNNKNNINIFGQIYENFWNNKKSISLIIKDLNL
jgi:single-stranded-DNA-specific exonuclease